MRRRIFTLASAVSLLLAVAFVVAAVLTHDEAWKWRSWDDSAGVHHDLYLRRGRLSLIHYMPTPFYQPPNIIRGTLAIPVEFIDFRVNLVPFCAILMVLPGSWLYRWMRWRKGIANGLCPNCDYNLTGNTSGTCPECGTAIPAPTNKESPRPA